MNFQYFIRWQKEEHKKCDKKLKNDREEQLNEIAYLNRFEEKISRALSKVPSEPTKGV